MTRGNNVTTLEKSHGDSAVDGVLAGLAAAVTSALMLFLTGVFSGYSPIDVLAHFDIAMAGNAVTGGLLHLATSAVYGIGFGILYQILGSRWNLSIRAVWIAGIVYGLILFLIAEIVLLSGFDTNLRELSAFEFTLFHIVYGLTLGIVLERTNR